MSSLVDLLSDAAALLLGGVIPGPSTDRGQLRLLTLLGAASGAFSLWLATEGAAPVRIAPWSLGLLVLTLVVAAAGLALAVTRLLRYRTERGWAITYLAANIVALIAVSRWAAW